MTNREYLIKLLEEKDGAIMNYLTCESCIYRNKTCDAFRKTCERGRSKWLEKEREEEKMNEELKPCPFCGGNVSITYNTGDSAFCIWHNGAVCTLQEPFKIDVACANNFAEATKVWNRRIEQ